MIGTDAPKTAMALAGSRSIAYALSCVVIWSFIAVVSRAGQNDMDAFQYLFWSNSFSAVAVFIVSLIAGRRATDLLRPDWRRFRLPGLLGLLDCLFYLLIYYGYSTENGVAVIVVQYSWPLIIVGLAALCFGERISVWQRIGMGLGFVAVAVTLTQGHLTRIAVQHPHALVLVFAGAFCFALLSVLSRRSTVDAYVGTFWLFCASTLASLVLMISFSSVAWPGSSSLPAVVVNGVLINGLSYILWIKAMATGEAAKIASLVFLAPVLSIIWLVVFYDEPFVPAYAAGVALAVISGLLCTRGPETTKA